MKKILFILSFTSVLIFAKPCMTDIYTGNGVNTSDDGAFSNMKALRIFMQNKANMASRLDFQEYNINYSFKYIHNPDHGFNNDLIETYYQLKESGQISDGFFHMMFSLLAGNIPENTLHQKYIDIVGTYESDVHEIYNKYYSFSFSKKHNVLLVSHSQGNLIGNKIYTLMSDAEKKKFRMVSVATPASYVKIPGVTSPYVTVHADLVINNPLIPAHLPSNIAGTGHNFIHTYLDAHSNARHLIASYIKSAYDNLIQTTSCDQYEYYVWISYQCPSRSSQELVVDIYGRPSNAPYPYIKQLVTSDTRVRMPHDTNGNCTVQEDDAWSWWSEYDKNGCYAYSIDDTAGNHHTLDYVAAQTYNNGNLCTQYKMLHETTEILRSLLSTPN